jgi:hypothetical protein
MGGRPAVRSAQGVASTDRAPLTTGYSARVRLLIGSSDVIVYSGRGGGLSEIRIDNVMVYVCTVCVHNSLTPASEEFSAWV